MSTTATHPALKFAAWTPDTGTAEIWGLPIPPVPGTPAADTEPMGMWSAWVGVPSSRLRAGRARMFRTAAQLSRSRTADAILALIGLLGTVYIVHELVMTARAITNLFLIITNGGF